jgi:hypothetical protein
MTFEELLKNVAQIKCVEKRAMTADGCEVVIATDELKQLNEILSSYFGPPQKMQGGQFSSEAEQVAEPYGGVRSGQTMYFRNVKTGVDLALLWPWGNGTSLTVKIIRNE